MTCRAVRPSVHSLDPAVLQFMAISRPVAAQIRKLLDAAREPVYLVDGDGTLVFVNPALAEWLGVAADELMGQSCRYHTELATPSAAAIAARLCPPPAVLAGERVTATIGALRFDGTIVERAIDSFPSWAKPARRRWSSRACLSHPLRLRRRRATIAALNRLRPSGISRSIAIARRIAERYRSEHLLGDSLAARRIRAQVEMAAASTGHVLIVGPSGSGRQHLARVIHQTAMSATPGMLLPLACPLLGLEVLTSSLHAVTRPLANGEPRATLLLLEVDQLSVETQAALVESLGAGSPVFRILATARTSLETLAARGEYQRELPV